MTVNLDKVRAAVADLLVGIGEDPNRPGLRETPDRVARAWAEMLTPDTTRLDTCFDEPHSGSMVLIRGVRVWSTCEHHLMPFWCNVAIAYVPNGKVLGLSKLARIAVSAGRRLQLQERLVNDIARKVCEAAGTRSVAVIAEGLAARGARQGGALMLSSAYLGAFTTTPELQAEFRTLALRP
jgi:GTP cyclohydrolase IA